MNIYDVAKKAGVSIATVSRVMNGNPNVSRKTRQKVLDVMEESGYTPNVFARGLGLNTMHTVGLMCTDSSDPFLANAVYYLERELRMHGYDSFLCCTGYELNTKQKYLELLLSKRVDAIIFVGSSYLEAESSNNAYIINAATNVPVMLINGFINKPNIYCTLCDDYGSMHDAAMILLEQGKQNILYLYSSKSYSGIQKLKGFKAAITEKLGHVNEVSIRMCPLSIDIAKELLKDLTGQGMLFDAVIASEDILAIGAIKYAKEMSIDIPNALSIIGYNNSLLASCSDPELTSIDNHVETLSITTVGTLMRVINGLSAPNKTMISNNLVIRNTTNFNYQEVR